MTQRHEFCIHAARVEPSGSDFTFDVGPEWLARELTGCEAEAGTTHGTLAVHISPISPGYWVQGAVKVTLRAQCFRCLRMTDLEVDQPIKVHMLPGPPSRDHDEESYSDDGSLGVGHYQGEEIVLDNLVRESIVLALPMSPRCASGCSIEDLYRDDDK